MADLNHKLWTAGPHALREAAARLRKDAARLSKDPEQARTAAVLIALAEYLEQKRVD